jgi:hypothetical protein
MLVALMVIFAEMMMAASLFVRLAMMMIVGAALGIKRRFDRRQPCAEPAQHILDDVIAPDAQPVANDLHVDVTITNVPGEARQIVAVRGGDFNERLGPSDDPDDRAVVEHQAIAIAERSSLRKIEQEFGAALAVQHDPAAMAVMGIECDRVNGRRLIPVSGGFDVACALHG